MSHRPDLRLEPTHLPFDLASANLGMDDLGVKFRGSPLGLRFGQLAYHMIILRRASQVWAFLKGIVSCDSEAGRRRP
jgi:hypothetical protein